MREIRWARLLGVAMVAFLVAVTSLTILFGNPFIREILYTDQAGQSDKILAVWLEQEPLPAVTPFWDDLADFSLRGLAVQGMLLAWAFSLVLIYALAWAPRPGPAWRKGATFGLAAWAILFVFFEAFIPFNLLGEPFGLVLVELALELVAMVVTGLAIGLLYPSHPNRG